MLHQVVHENSHRSGLKIGGRPVAAQGKDHPTREGQETPEHIGWEVHCSIKWLGLGCP